MNKSLDIANLIIVIAIIVISIIVIVNNFTLDFKYYLKVDSSNRQYIEKTVLEKYKLTGTLNKIAYNQGLGDWCLFLYYEDGTEDSVSFGDCDSKAEEMRGYIVANGYNEFEAKWSKVYFSFRVIKITIIYGIGYLILRSLRRRKQQA